MSSSYDEECAQCDANAQELEHLIFEHEIDANIQQLEHLIFEHEIERYFGTDSEDEDNYNPDFDGSCIIL